MPRRRRNRNQKRRNTAGGESGGCRAGDGDEAASAEREAPRPTEGVRGDVLTLAILNDNLQTTWVPRVDAGIDGDRRDDKCAGANGKIIEDERITEINGKINIATPTRDTANYEPNILNNMTPKRTLRNPRNEPYIDNLCTSSSTALLKSNRPYKFRSNSSTSKLRSPGTERIPLTIDASTQTVNFKRTEQIEETLHLESCINIFETPKISQLDLLKTPPVNIRKRIDIEKLDFKPLNLNRIRYKKLKNFSEILFGESEFKSDTEISFQNLLDAKDVSTPIKKNVNVTTPQNNKNNCSSRNNRSKEKVKAKKFETSLVTKRRYKTISPRKNREIAIRNIPPMCELKKKQQAIPKSFTPPRTTHCKTTENILNVSTEQGRFVTRAKKFHTRFVGRWIARILEICNWLGLSLKKTLTPSSSCKTQQPKLDEHPAIAPISAPLPTCNSCEEYRLKLVVLSSKIEVLERELGKSTQESREVIATLLEEIAKIKLELSEIGAIKKQLQEMEEIMKSKPVPGACVVPAPPPLPPPCAPPLPPPLPPPMMLNFNVDSPVARPRSGGGGARRPERKSNENSRPVISLDDILKVKLKKTTDRPLSARRSPQPLISVEMLNQIKLRPTSRPETPCLKTPTDMNSSKVLSGSPATSLSKILSNVDPNEACFET